jgi:phosphoglycolate phosphatase-like HAD superfamily hydrolase
LGDSVADIEAAIACGATPIGFANKAGKSEKLRAAGATSLFCDLREFLAWLKGHSSGA